MFSKALFKQSMKANWVKWVSVTVSTCVMLAIVIIVLGNLGINNIRDSLKDVFTQADQESTLKTNALDSYDLYLNSVDFENGVITVRDMDIELLGGQSALSLFWTMATPHYDTALSNFQAENPDTELTEEVLAGIRATATESAFTEIKGYLDNPLVGSMVEVDFTDDELKQFISILLLAYENDSTVTGEDNIAVAMQTAFLDYVETNAYNTALAGEDATEQSALASSLSARQLASDAIDSYISQKTEAEQDGGTFTYNNDNFKTEANEYVNDMIYDQVLKTFTSGIDQPTDEQLAEAETWAVASKVLANTSITTYEFWLKELTTDPETGESLTLTDEQMAEVITQARDEATGSITDQIQDEDVVTALEELGNMDIYSLIIGSIFYRIAGLLLPMVFVIMTANGLLAGQVDSGSMAYVLSTPTKRRTVTVTQMTYLIVSLFAMFALLTVTSVIAVWISGGNSFAINYAQILLFNLGAFLTMFAIAGFCFMCSAIFNRTKYSLGIGGGITIFSLVCTILGLFGSSVVPSAMRISAMNFFNYLSVITLYDTVSIMAGSLAYLWKFGILLGIGIVCFIIGIFRFDKKDLPL